MGMYMGQELINIVLWTICLLWMCLDSDFQVWNGDRVPVCGRPCSCVFVSDNTLQLQTFHIIITFKVIDSGVFPSKYGPSNICELCGLPESSIGDNQVIMVLGIQANGDVDFLPSFSVN